MAPVFTEADPKTLPKEEQVRLLHDTATVYVDLQTLGQILQQLEDQYAATLKAS